MNGTASTDTWFAGLFGIKHFNVSAHANGAARARRARGHRGRDRPHGLHVRHEGPGCFCRDLDNAKDGVQSMLKLLNPPYAQVGMVAFPPVQDDLDERMRRAL